MGTMKIDKAEIETLAALLRAEDLGEIEVEEGGSRIRVVARAPVSAPVATTPAPGLLPPAPMVECPGAPPPAGAVLSPMVGTAYLQPEPDAPPFVKPGDTVAAGDTLLIVEAMKVMNQI